jgi:CheY-specific phosphatase CheX
MPLAFEIDAYQIDLSRIVDDVFRTMLGTGAYPAAGPQEAGEGSLTAAVQFVGEWQGAVLMQCGTQQAAAFTRALMPGVQPSSPGVFLDEDVRDALGELINMVGGNLKSVLVPGVVLSMPSVVQGCDYALHICRSNAVKTVEFASDLGAFSVSLVQIVSAERN